MRATLHLPRTGAALATIALAGLLVACGNAGDSNSAKSGANSASAGTFDQRYDEWENKFRSCLNDKGFELPKEAGKVDFGDRQDAYEAASDACRAKIGKAPQTTGDRSGKSDKQLAQEDLELLQCLRDRGAKVTDPGAKQAPQIEFPEGVSQDAYEECYAR